MCLVQGNREGQRTIVGQGLEHGDGAGCARGMSHGSDAHRNQHVDLVPRSVQRFAETFSTVGMPTRQSHRLSPTMTKPETVSSNHAPSSPHANTAPMYRISHGVTRSATIPMKAAVITPRLARVPSFDAPRNR